MQVRDAEFEVELESEAELEDEFEDESEDQFELEDEYEGEEFLGTIARGLGGLFGGAGEFEDEYEGELEYEDELEGEEFFRRVGQALRRAAPVLRQIARTAAPIVGTVVGGPVGGMVARHAASLLESEDELEAEFEDEATPRAVAEMMAAAASQARTEAEAEALIGAATVASLTPRERRLLIEMVPHLVRGAATLVQLFRRRRITRPAVRVIPTIVQGTAATLARRAAAGAPVTPQVAGRVMAGQVRRIVGNPQQAARVAVRNARLTRRVARPVRPAFGPQRRMPRSRRSGGVRRGVVRTPSGRVLRARVVPAGRPVPRRAVRVVPRPRTVGRPAMRRMPR